MADRPRQQCQAGEQFETPGEGHLGDAFPPSSSGGLEAGKSDWSGVTEPQQAVIARQGPLASRSQQWGT